MFKDTVLKDTSFQTRDEKVLYEIEQFRSKKTTLAPHAQRRELKDLNQKMVMSLSYVCMGQPHTKQKIPPNQTQHLT